MASPWDAVELWTSSSFLETNGPSKAKSEVQHYFESKIFYLSTSETIPKYLRSRLTAAEETRSPFVVIAYIPGNPIWLTSVLSETFPMLGSSPMKSMLDVRQWERGTAFLPVVDKANQCMGFFLQYPMVEKANSTIKFCPVATWVMAPLSVSRPCLQIGSSPIIFMACRDGQVQQRLQDHCVSGNWDFHQLGSAPGRIFIDLFSFLAEWSDVWRLARQELARRDTELHSETRSVEILRQTRDLHRATADLIAMREDLRLHVTAFQKYRYLVKAFPAKGSYSWIVTQREQGSVEDRVEECLQNLLYLQEGSDVIHKQLENLLNLAFNTEMVSQGQSVARLNTLAFAFLPLSYVATLFGMTNFSIPAKWYPVGAVIILFCTQLGFVCTAFFRQWQTKRLANPSTKLPAAPATERITLNDIKAKNAPQTNTYGHPYVSTGSAPLAEPSPSTLDSAASRQTKLFESVNPYPRIKKLARRKPQIGKPHMPLPNYSPNYTASSSVKVRLPMEPSFLSTGLNDHVPHEIRACPAQQPLPPVYQGYSLLPAPFPKTGEASDSIPLLHVPTPSTSRPSTLDSWSRLE
ncbi:hypothetical protein P154DRAFT_559354 [Amniculicola lignicola CBS 123094]|uniref:Cora-domain-containing protein n=1 Tax=Amniculicola lignicola CBS 123094 TaxID=1392246 RepID=A0A6A5X1Z9_9PLEO|nr:hypothetical protein P154DRAFT_559354 [Amniculicola lignicola CBS 123094]